MQRHAQVVDRARQRGEVEEVVDLLVDEEGIDHVVVPEREPIVAQMLDVLERRDDQVVDADDAMPLLEQVFAQMRAEEAGTARDE